MFGIGDPDCPVDLQKLTASVKQHEGCRLQLYTDTTGNPSIAYGRNLRNGISHDEADLMLSNDLNRALSQAQAQPWWPHVKDNDARARAFIEIVFNVGIRDLAGFSKALDAAMRDDWSTCSAEFLDSLWHRQVGVRAEVLCAMILTGEDPMP
jgi:lysozyme